MALLSFLTLSMELDQEGVRLLGEKMIFLKTGVSVESTCGWADGEQAPLRRLCEHSLHGAAHGQDGPARGPSPHARRPGAGPRVSCQIRTRVCCEVSPMCSKPPRQQVKSQDRAPDVRGLLGMLTQEAGTAEGGGRNSCVSRAAAGGPGRPSTCSPSSGFQTGKERRVGV